MNRPWAQPPILELVDVNLDRLARLARSMVQETRFLASSGQRDSSPGDIPFGFCFGIVGTLGAGKTRFCQEIAGAWGIAESDVTSPTFTLIRSYELVSSRTDASQRSALAWPVHRMHHLDLYRIGDEDEFWDLGVDELWDDEHAWTLIEWADRFADCLPETTIWIEMQDDGSRVSSESPSPPEMSVGSRRNITFHASQIPQIDWLTRVASRMIEEFPDGSWITIRS